MLEALAGFDRKLKVWDCGIEEGDDAVGKEVGFATTAVAGGSDALHAYQ